MLKEKELAEKDSLAQTKVVAQLTDELEASLKHAGQERGRTAEMKAELEVMRREIDQCGGECSSV